MEEIEVKNNPLGIKVYAVGDRTSSICPRRNTAYSSLLWNFG